jgi:hypothetical protein
MARILTATAGLIAVLLAAPGCANYQLGTGSAPSFRSIYVEPVANHTLVPQSQAILSTRLREMFLRDARVRPVNSPAGADATLTVVITDYRREIATVREGDTGLARKFNVTMAATCTLRDNRSGQNVWEGRPVTAIREIFTDSGQLQSEYQVLPLLAEVLASRILHATLDTW